MTRPYRLWGMTRSYFTRKMSAYLEYKDIPHVFRPFGGMHPAARAAGWPGGIPVVETPDGEFMWDTTSMILHLEQRFPDPAVLPDDPVHRFLCFAIEDVVDEWFYRPAVGSRWLFPRNREHGSWELARDATCEVPVPCAQAAEMVAAYVTATCPGLGTSAENIQSWVDEVVIPWLRALNEHLDHQPYLFGARPSLADFALFGADAAHFVADPECRRWADEHGPAVVRHTHRLLHPDDPPGAWLPGDDVPATLIAILRDMGRLYLPWVSRATTDGVAEVVFASGQRVEIAAPPFLCAARATLLARYGEARSARLDAVLSEAGILPYFADFGTQAGTIPTHDAPPKPTLNRAFAPPPEIEAATLGQAG